MGWIEPFCCPKSREAAAQLAQRRLVLSGVEDQAMYERYLVNLFRALEDRPEKRSLRTVIGLLDPAALAIELRD
jgi:hypothetical protein